MQKALQSSVVLTTFNGAKFLSAQLASLAGQSRSPGELVVCDDGSADGTVELLEAFARQAAFPVRLHKNPRNLGFAQNFAHGISLASHDIIFPCDQDDTWSPHKLEVFLARFERDEALGALFSDSELVGEAGYKLGNTLSEANGFSAADQRLYAKGQGWRVALRRNVVAGHAMGFRASARPLLLPVPPGQPHDAWIARFFSFAGKIDYLPEVHTAYRQHQRQEVGTTSGIAARARKSAGRSWSDLRLEAAAWKELLARVECAGAGHEPLAQLRRKAAWMRARAEQSSLWRRIPFALAHWAEYREFENGASTIGKDWLTKA